MSDQTAPTKPSLETGMLAYARALQISEGLFFGKSTGLDAVRVPVPVLEKGVRGQSSEDRAKNPGLSNPQTVEFAVVPHGCDLVELEFSIRVLPAAMRPHACNDTNVRATHMRIADAYARAGGFGTLAELFAWNVANARFAWRNRFQSDAMSVTVRFEGGELTFDPLELDLGRPSGVDGIAAAMISGDGGDLSRFIEGIAAGLSDDPFVFSVTWAAEMVPGQEIFPSQEYVRKSRQEEDVSRIYAKLPVVHQGRRVQQASMHSQKIGAAIRHVDVWHGSEEYGAIAVNPYGGVQESGHVLRTPKSKKSFYDIRKKAAELLAGVEAAKRADEITPEAHFFMANLVRGGVFGASGKAANSDD